MDYKIFKCKYTETLQNQKGATLIYILAAFMIISFIGVTMIKQSHHDVSASSDFASMSTAHQAAKSGIQATVSYLEGKPDSTVAILNRYIKNNAPEWILGDTTPANRVAISGQEKFSTQLMAFSYDTTNADDFRVTVKSYGFGKGKSRKNIISVIDIDGVSWLVDSTLATTTVPANALHLGSGADELNTPITVYGDTYIKGGGYMYGGSATYSEFNGKFIVDTSSSMFRIKYANFHGPVYCAGNIDMTGGTAPSTFDSGFGAEGLVKVGTNAGPYVSGGNVYLNGSYDQNNGSSTKMNLHNQGRLHGKSPSTNYITSSSGANLNTIADSCVSIHLEANTMDIRDSLNIPDSMPTIPINLTDIRPKAIDVKFGFYGGLDINVDGEALNDFYEDTDPSDLYKNKWLVLNYKGSNGTPFKTGGSEKFKYKVIWIVENVTLDASGHFYEHDTTTGVTFLYIGTGGTINPGIGGCEMFRGFIYLDSPGTTSDIFKGKADTEFRGGIYCTNTTKKFRLVGLGSGGPFTVRYDGGVLAELSALGIFDTALIMIPTVQDSLVLINPIETTELGLHF